MGTITWAKVEAGTALLLGTIEGADTATAETNYTGALSTSTVRSPDFPPTAIYDACVNAAMEIAKAICESDNHPETVSFVASSSAVSSGATAPAASSGSVPRIGPIRRVKDGSNSRTLDRETVSAVRDYNAASATIFNGYNAYYYAINGDIIEHTRTTVICDMCCFNRATFTGQSTIPLNDEHERLIIMGAVTFLGMKEGMYADLANRAAQEFDRGLQIIRGVAQNVDMDVRAMKPGGSL